MTTLTADALAAAATRAPRYTSYPPATEFAALSSAQIADELARVRDDGAPISLYVHVPFCRSRCAYCGCNVIPSRDARRPERYAETIVREAELVAETLGNVPVAELALGGGSPNTLTPRTLCALMGALRKNFAFAPGARLAVELDPRDTTSAQIEAFAGEGFTAVSMGVQDFAPAVQDAIRRHQSVAQTAWLVERARAAGFTDVNVDIVYGLPHQTPASFAATLDAVIALAPDRVALFGYAHLPDRLPHQRIVERRGRVLDAHERAELLLLATDKLAGAGYAHLGLDHFARPGSPLARAAADGRMARSFQGYVERTAASTIGLGVSAISSTPRMYWQNHTALPPYEHLVARGEPPVARGFVLGDDDRIRRALIERLMCDGRVDLGALGVDVERYFAPELRALDRDDTLAAFDERTQMLQTTPLGKLLVRNVCLLFDRYAGGAGRFSPTV